MPKLHRLVTYFQRGIVLRSMQKSLKKRCGDGDDDVPIEYSEVYMEAAVKYLKKVISSKLTVDTRR